MTDVRLHVCTKITSTSRFRNVNLKTENYQTEIETDYDNSTQRIFVKAKSHIAPFSIQSSLIYCDTTNILNCKNICNRTYRLSLGNTFELISTLYRYCNCNSASLKCDLMTNHYSTWVHSAWHIIYDASRFDCNSTMLNTKWLLIK